MWARNFLLYCTHFKFSSRTTDDGINLELIRIGQNHSSLWMSGLDLKRFERVRIIKLVDRTTRTVRRQAREERDTCTRSWSKTFGAKQTHYNMTSTHFDFPYLFDQSRKHKALDSLHPWVWFGVGSIWSPEIVSAKWRGQNKTTGLPGWFRRSVPDFIGLTESSFFPRKRLPLSRYVHFDDSWCNLETRLNVNL
jgi:hypothetical protein